MESNQNGVLKLKLTKEGKVHKYKDILYDLVDSIEGGNADATASAIHNIVDTLLPGNGAPEELDDFLVKLQEELDAHIGG